MKFLVPEKCPCCGSPYKGGSQIPGEPLKEGCGKIRIIPWITFKGPRVWYECGASICITEKAEFWLGVQLKNCNCKECKKADNRMIKKHRALIKSVADEKIERRRERKNE